MALLPPVFFRLVKIWPFSETRKHWYLSFTTTYNQESTIKTLQRSHALAISLIYVKLEAVLIELCHFSSSFFHPKLPQSLDLGFLRNQSSDCTISRRFGKLFACAFDISPAFWTSTSLKKFVFSLQRGRQNPVPWGRWLISRLPQDCWS